MDTALPYLAAWALAANVLGLFLTLCISDHENTISQWRFWFQIVMLVLFLPYLMLAGGIYGLHQLFTTGTLRKIFLKD